MPYRRPDLPASDHSGILSPRRLRGDGAQGQFGQGVEAVVGAGAGRAGEFEGADVPGEEGGGMLIKILPISTKSSMSGMGQGDVVVATATCD